MNNPNRLALDAPAIYSIRVEGGIGERWRDWFNDLAITVQVEESTVTSTLQGTVADQAALLGLLQKLYGLGFPLLEVRCESPSRADLASRPLDVLNPL